MAGLTFGPSAILLISFGIFAPALHEAFKWSIGRVATGVTIISLMAAIISPIQGRLVDRFGSRTMILVSLPLFGLGFAAISLIGSDIRAFYLLCVGLPVLALGAWPLSFMRIVPTWFDRRLGFALGITNVGPGLGTAIVPLIAGVTMANYGWRAAYIVLGSLPILIAVPIALAWLRENPSFERDRTQLESGSTLPGLEMRQILRGPSFWLLTLAFMGLGFFSSGLLTHQVNILIDHGMSRNQAIGVQSTLGVAAIFGRIAGGWLLDRVHVSRFMFVLMAGGTGACWIYATSASGPLLIAAAVMAGLIIGSEFDACGYAIRRYHGLRNFGVVYGLIFGIFQIGSAAGAFVVGAQRDATGSFASGLALAGGIGFVAGLTFLCLGVYRFYPHGVAAPIRESESNQTR